MKKLYLLATVALAAAFPVAKLHAQVGQLLKTFDLKTSKLLTDPARPRVYALLPAENSLAIIDTDTLAVIKTVFIGSSPTALSISPDGKRLYVANSGSTIAGIGVLDLDSLQTLPALPAPGSIRTIAAGSGGRLYTAATDNNFQSKIYQLDATTGAVQTSITSGYYDDGTMNITPDGKTLFTGTQGISPPSLKSLDVSGTMPILKQDVRSVGAIGSDIPLSHDSRFILTTSQNGSTGVSLASTANVTSVYGTFSASGTAATFSADDRLVYIATPDFSSGGSTVSINNATTFLRVNEFRVPSQASSSGYSGNPISLAVAPSGFLFLSTPDGTFNNAPGKLRAFGTEPRAAFFIGEVQLSGGFYYVQFPNGTPFGYYAYIGGYPYLYHNDLGFEYVFDAKDSGNGVFLYDFASNTFWYTSPSLFPYLYDFNLNTFLYYFPDTTKPARYTTNPRYFYNFATSQIITK